MVEGKLSTHRDTQAGVPQGSVLSPTLCTLYINETLNTPGVYLALFASDTYLHTTDPKEGYVLRELQRGVTSMESWCERWHIKINEDKTQAICFSHRQGPFVSFLTLKGLQAPFVNYVKYLGVVID
jgi:hypothetical protein